MSDTYTVSYPVSADCRTAVGHLTCAHDDAAWDHVLDSPATCTCRCHEGWPVTRTGRIRPV